MLADGRWHVAPNLSNRILLGLSALMAGVGAAHAAVGEDWDAFALFTALAFMMAALLIRTVRGRPAVPLRADLVAWLEERATSGGESVEEVADRAVSAYRAGLSRPGTGHRHDA